MSKNSTISIEELSKLYDEGAIDTVLVCMVDMQGRLMGKRVHAAIFIDSIHEETHCCNYLLATDLEMDTPDGFASTSWQSGYGDYIMKPDLSTLRCVPWLEGTALVLSDIIDHETHAPVPFSPRQMLKKQLERLGALGYDAIMATELEFFLFRDSFQTLADNGYKDLTPISAYNEDYHILQTTKEEHVMRPVRNHLYAMGIPVEGTKGEAEAGQEELNIRYADALGCADHHTIAKHAVKEIAWQNGHAVTFLSKWHHSRVGSSSHVHQSLWKEGESVFYDADAKHGMSEVMKQYMAGLIKYSSDFMFFMAPYINSYKRFAKGSFAPTKNVWSVDNRCAAFRLCAENTKAVRVECRVPGSDMNPYLVLAAMLAAGMKGIEEKLPLSDPYSGNVYDDDSLPDIPGTLLEAKETLANSSMLRESMGDEVIDHYVNSAQVQIDAFERVVTDWEIQHGFERA